MSQGSAALAVVETAAPDGERPDLALQGLVLLAQFHGVAADAAQLAHEFGRVVNVSTKQRCCWRRESSGSKRR